MGQEVQGLQSCSLVVLENQIDRLALFLVFYMTLNACAFVVQSICYVRDLIKCKNTRKYTNMDINTGISVGLASLPCYW